MGIIDKYLFEKRGAHGCSNSDYLLHRTTCCGRTCVEDNELLELYVDPDDLNRRVTLRGDVVACPFCGSVKWNLEEILDVADIPDEWRWACFKA